MDNKWFQTVCNIVFCLLTVGLFYLMPYIAWHTMEGDKTDIILGMVIGFIPLGLLLLSILYGFLAKRIIVPVCMASVLGIPAVFIPVIAGNTVLEKILSLVFITVVISIIVYIGTAFSIFIHWFLRKIMLSLGTISE